MRVDTQRILNMFNTCINTHINKLSTNNKYPFLFYNRDKSIRGILNDVIYIIYIYLRINFYIKEISKFVFLIHNN